MPLSRLICVEMCEAHAMLIGATWLTACKLPSATALGIPVSPRANREDHKRGTGRDMHTKMRQQL